MSLRPARPPSNRSVDRAGAAGAGPAGATVSSGSGLAGLAGGLKSSGSSERSKAAPNRPTESCSQRGSSGQSKERGGGCQILSHASPENPSRCGKANKVGSLSAISSTVAFPARCRMGAEPGRRGRTADLSLSQKINPTCTPKTSATKIHQRRCGHGRGSTEAALMARPAGADPANGRGSVARNASGMPASRARSVRLDNHLVGGVLVRMHEQR